MVAALYRSRLTYVSTAINGSPSMGSALLDPLLDNQTSPNHQQDGNPRADPSPQATNLNAGTACMLLNLPISARFEYRL
ncbi:hypothetical protein TgHK011_009329 [Trichoderma gracile]|nr:hypothetical protein TgHK011_009329 [Trichoderma gracile]